MESEDTKDSEETEEEELPVVTSPVSVCAHAERMTRESTEMARAEIFLIGAMDKNSKSEKPTLGCYRMQRTSTAKWLLILSLVFVFGYFGFDKFAHPLTWIGWLPVWMDNLGGLPKNLWLNIIGALEIIFAIMLLIPLRKVQQAAAILMILHLIAVLTQVGWNDVAVRDIGIMISGIALLALL